MSEPVRIGLRLFGFVMFVVGIGLIVILFYPGPRDVADWMGSNCAHTKNGPSEQCNIFDVLSIIGAAPILILVGGVMALALRPEGASTPTIDLSGLRRE